MRSVPERCPADFVRARTPSERLSNQWDGIERIEAGRQRARSRRRQFVRLGAGAALLALLGMASFHRNWIVRGHDWLASVTGSPASPSGESASRVSGYTHQLLLGDGSTMLLADDTRAQVVTMTATEVRVHLEAGQLECEVTHVPTRQFVVETHGFEVVVRGTRFSVAVESAVYAGESVLVSVTRGAVEVRRAGGQLLAVLGPEQSLSLRHASWGTEMSSSPEPQLQRQPP